MLRSTNWGVGATTISTLLVPPPIANRWSLRICLVSKDKDVYAIVVNLLLSWPYVDVHNLDHCPLPGDSKLLGDLDFVRDVQIVVDV